ncbi:MAG: DUF6427 family protein [Chitinophagales bacterium]
MLRFLKSNTPVLMALNVLLVVLTRLIWLVAPVDIHPLYQHQEPLSAWLFERLLFHFQPAFFVIAGGVFTFLQSLMVNNLINRHKATGKRNYLGGILFILMTTFFREFLLFTPVQIALFFLLIICDKIFRLVRPEKQSGEIFDLGFLSALAALFYAPSVLFLPLALIGIYTMRPFSFRELWIVLFGMTAVVFTVFTYYFCNDRLMDLKYVLVTVSQPHLGVLAHLTNWDIGILIWMGLLTIAAILGVQGVLYASSIQIRKFTGVITVSALIAVLSAALCSNFSWAHLTLLALPMSFLLCLFFVESKESRVLTILLTILFLSVPLVQYGPFIF